VLAAGGLNSDGAPPNVIGGREGEKQLSLIVAEKLLLPSKKKALKGGFFP